MCVCICLINRNIFEVIWKEQSIYLITQLRTLKIFMPYNVLYNSKVSGSVALNLWRITYIINDFPLLSSATTNIQKAPRLQVSKEKKWMEGLSSWRPAGLWHERPLVLARFMASWLCCTLLGSVALKPAPLCYGLSRELGQFNIQRHLGTICLGPSACHVFPDCTDWTQVCLEVCKHFAGCQQKQWWAILANSIQVCSFLLQVSDLSFLAK